MAEKGVSSQKYLSEAHQVVLSQLASLQNNATLSDFTITCGAQQWKVHRLVLYLQSPVLAKACEGPFKEAGQGCLDLPDDHPAAIGALIQYLYELDYAFAPAGTESDTSVLGFHIHVSIAADKYDMQPLQALAATKFKTIAEKCNIPDFVDAALQAYETQQASRVICDIIITIAMEHELLRSDASAKGQPCMFAKAMRQCAELAADFAIALHTHMSSPDTWTGIKPSEKRYLCPGTCERTQILELEKEGGPTYACSYCERSFSVQDWRDLGYER